MRLNEILDLYHVSSNPDLIINPDFDLRHGEMGRGFYVTAEPDAWVDTLDDRHYVYQINSQHLKIAKDRPAANNKEFVQWAIAQGYMEMAVVKKPSGQIVYELDDKTPLVRPQLTEKGKKFYWQDPMTGNTLNDLQNEYLRDHGFNAYEAGYSKEGHQIIIFDLSGIELKKVR